MGLVVLRFSWVAWKGNRVFVSCFSFECVDVGIGLWSVCVGV